MFESRESNAFSQGDGDAIAVDPVRVAQMPHVRNETGKGRVSKRESERARRKKARMRRRREFRLEHGVQLNFSGSANITDNVTTKFHVHKNNICMFFYI